MEEFHHTGIGETVHFGDDPSPASGLTMADLPFDQSGETVAHIEGGDGELIPLFRGSGASGEQIE